MCSGQCSNSTCSAITEVIRSSTKVYELGSEEMRNIRRSSFADCVNHIIGLCDAAAADLNVEPRGAAGGYGNMTKGAALAIKAKTLVYAASPLYNQTTNTNPLLGYVGSTDVTTKWQTAAKACADVINLKKTNGQNKYTLNTDYEKLFIIQPNNNTEYIVTRNSVKANGLEERQYHLPCPGKGRIKEVEPYHHRNS